MLTVIHGNELGNIYGQEINTQESGWFMNDLPTQKGVDFFSRLWFCAVITCRDPLKGINGYIYSGLSRLFATLLGCKGTKFRAGVKQSALPRAGDWKITLLNATSWDGAGVLGVLKAQK